jgi:tetratricopeptide (TPR) repeat protein
MKKHVGTALSLSLLLAGAAALAGDLEDGQALQQSGKFEQALPKFQAAAKADPANAAAALGLSQVLSGLGRYDEAARAVDAARKAHPEDASLLAAKGRAYFLSMIQAEGASEPDDSFISACHDDAMRWAKEAMKLDQKNVEALLLLGQIHQRDKNGDQAIQFFQQAANADPKSFDAAFEVGNHWYLKANADRSNMEYWSSAEQGFLAALRIDGKSARAAANVAHCKAWQKLPLADVQNAYLRALALAPADAEILRKVFQWTPVPERVATMQKLADEMPKDVTRKLFLASALSGAKEFKKALDVLGDAATLEPHNPYVPLNEGDVSLEEGKHVDEAIDFYVEAMTLFKSGKDGIDDTTYGRLAGTVAFQNQKLSESQREKLWNALWKLFPDRTDATNNAGLWFRDVGKDYKKSLEWYLRAAKAAPDDCCIQNDTGLIYHYHMDDLDKAEPYYRRAVAIGKEKNYDCNAGNDPDRGFRDALNNMYKILSKQKRWSDLKKFVEHDVPASHPLREVWLREAEQK